MSSLTFYNIGSRCREVNLAEPRPRIDLSDVTFFEPFALVYLGMFLRYFNSLGKSCDVAFPRDEKVLEYLARQQFWGRFNFYPHIVQAENLRRFTTSTSLNDIADVEKTPYVAEELAEAVAHVVRTNTAYLPASAIAEVAAELVQNFVEHSGQNLAAFAVQYYPKRGSNGTLVLAVGDCGLGIRARLSSKEQFADLADRPHYEAILKAFEPGVSSKPEGGTGFNEVLDYIAELAGEFRIASGDDYVIVNGKTGKARTAKTGFDLTGVQIELIFPGRQ